MENLSRLILHSAILGRTAKDAMSEQDDMISPSSHELTGHPGTSLGQGVVSRDLSFHQVSHENRCEEIQGRPKKTKSAKVKRKNPNVEAKVQNR